MGQDILYCKNCGDSFLYNGIDNICDICSEIEKSVVREMFCCKSCDGIFYYSDDFDDKCDNCLEQEKKDEDREYLIDFTNFIPEEQEETLRLIVDNNGSAGSLCDYIFRFKGKEFFLNEWEFEAMCKLIKRKIDADNLSEDEIFQ